MPEINSLEDLLVAVEEGSRDIHTVKIKACQLCKQSTITSNKEVIHKDEKTKTLTIEEIQITENDLKSILNKVFRLNHIGGLILEGIGKRLTQDIWEHIGKLLEMDNHIKSLTIRNCRLSDENLKPIINTLKTNRVLATLDLQSNLITTLGLLIMYEALPRSTPLKTLDVSYNPCRGDGIRRLERVIDDFTYHSFEDE